jgi:hypothetical protein
MESPQNREFLLWGAGDPNNIDIFIRLTGVVRNDSQRDTLTE